MIGDKCKIAYGHLLVNETSCVSCDEDRAAHICREICGKSLMCDSIALIVVDSSIPNYGPSALHDSIQQLLFVSDSGGNGTVRNIMQADYLDRATCLFEQV